VLGKRGVLQLFAVPEQRKGKIIFTRVSFEFHTPVSTNNINNTRRLLEVQPTRRAQFMYFCKLLYILYFRRFFRPSSGAQNCI